MNFYRPARLRNFWVSVHVGEGQLARLDVRPFPSPAGNNPTITQGHYLYAYGLPDEAIDRDLTIEADVLKTSQSSQASITADLWETIPARYIMPGSGIDPNEKHHLKTFEASGSFGPNKLAQLSIVIKIL